MSVLVLADTHLPEGRAHVLVDLLGSRLDRANMIIHAGDVTGAAVLDLLARYAPIVAVAGNNDVDLDIPTTTAVDVDGRVVAVVHDSGPARGRARRLAARFPAADVVVFGHSHLPWNEVVDVDGRIQRHFNPGSPTQRRRAPTRSVGWIDVDGSGIRCSHEHL